MFFEIKLALFLQLVVDLQGSFGRWHGQQHLNYFNLAISDDESLAGPHNDAHVPRSTIQNWGKGNRQPYQMQMRGAVPLPEDNYETVESEKVLFPDEVNAALMRVGTRSDALGSCMDTFSGKTFCEDVASYPLYAVNQAVENNKKIQSYENVDAVDNISVRFGANELDLCEFDSRIVKPRSAENRKKEWMYIINTNNVTQGVRVEICKDTKNSCKLIDGFAAGYTTFCKQMYTYRQLLAYSSDGTIIKDSFQFPTSCCCQVRQADVFSQVRIGRSAQNRQTNINAN